MDPYLWCLVFHRDHRLTRATPRPTDELSALLQATTPRPPPLGHRPRRGVARRWRARRRLLRMRSLAPSP